MSSNVLSEARKAEMRERSKARHRAVRAANRSPYQPQKVRTMRASVLKTRIRRVEEKIDDLTHNFELKIKEQNVELEFLRKQLNYYDKQEQKCH